MNIFLTSSDPVECAIALDTKRVVKMTLETAQLLSTACHLKWVDIGYRMTHANHPCGLWCQRSSGNFSWLVDHGLALADEYTYRTGKTHQSRQVIEKAREHIHLFNDKPVEFNFNSSGFSTGDVFHDYRLCLVHKWKRLDVIAPAWGNRERPSFLSELWNEV